MRNSIVLHYIGGMIKKGTTEDFFPNKDVFHLLDRDEGGIVETNLNDLKAVFFVKDFDGNPSYTDRNDVQRVGTGKKIRVNFKDGETLDGYTQGYSENRRGFFVFPCDPNSNNDRVYVVNAATDDIRFV